MVHRRPHQTDQKGVAGVMIRRSVFLHPLLQLHFDVQTQLARRRDRLAHMVRLHGTRRQQGIGTFGQGVANIVLQLPGLVAAKGETGAVIAFDPEFNTQVGTQVVEPFQGRGLMGQIN